MDRPDLEGLSFILVVEAIVFEQTDPPVEGVGSKTTSQFREKEKRIGAAISHAREKGGRVTSIILSIGRSGDRLPSCLSCPSSWGHTTSSANRLAVPDEITDSQKYLEIF